jgi:hypothetical protein
MLKALDIAAEMSGCGTPLPTGEARVIALEERGAEGNGSATINAMVRTISVSREGKGAARASAGVSVGRAAARCQTSAAPYPA